MIELKLVLLLYFTIISVLLTDAKYICKANVTDINTLKPIDNLKEYCENLSKPCAPKCCGLNEVLYREKINGTMQWPICVSTSSLGINVNYTILTIYKTTAGKDELKTEAHTLKTDKNFLNDFHLVQNKIFENKSCVERWTDTEPFILENGVFASDSTSLGNSWIEREPEYYCVDLIYNKKFKRVKVIFFIAKELGNENSEKELIFVGVASLISSVFLILVLMVYFVLPQLRNLSGMLLMAYVTTLLCTFVLKAIHIFFSAKMNCTETTIIFYFVYLSTFFWLNIMSFDIWWTFRAQRHKRATNRRGEVVKFMWYSLYGWGAPLAWTIVAAIIDSKRDELPANMVKPLFGTCLNSDRSVQYYLHIPTGSLVLINITLFLMTVYNIWLIKYKLNKFNSSSNSTEKNQNRFSLYVKLSMLMGASWLLEIAAVLYDDEVPFWAYVLIMIYNALIGLMIFIMFVLNKKVLRMLCKRFNIQWSFIEAKNFDPNCSRSTTKSSTNNGSYNKPSGITEDSNTELYNVEVSTNPNPK